MVRFALPFGAFTRLGQDSHKRDILKIFGKIEEGRWFKNDSRNHKNP